MLRPRDESDGRSALARGYARGDQAMGFALQIAIPSAVGYWLDQQLLWSPWCLIGGAVLGFVLGMRTLIEFATGQSSPRKAFKGIPSAPKPEAETQTESSASIRDPLTKHNSVKHDHTDTGRD